MGATNGTTDFDAVDGKVLSPSVLAHVVLRTSNLKKMQDFYISFLGGRLVYANEFLSFVTYDEEHHRVAFLEIPGTAPKDPNSCGLEHIAFTFPTLSDLLLSYRQRKAKGMSPVWCVNHGPTTSLYYKDPDGNMLETQVDNFDTPEETNDFIQSKEFQQNSIGTDFDPEELIAKVKSGVDEKTLKTRIEIGPRGMRNMDST